MEQLERWFREKQAERTIKALKKNNFEALYVSDSKAALEEVMKRIPDGATVGAGGSVTLTQIGLLDALKNRKIQLILPLQQARTDEERLELFRKSFSADVFLSSTNAVTEDGRLYNVDATGNQGGSHVHRAQKDDHRLRGEQNRQGSRGCREESERVGSSTECKAAGSKDSLC